MTDLDLVDQLHGMAALAAVPVHLNPFLRPGEMIRIADDFRCAIHMHPDTWARLKAAIRRARQEELFEPDLDAPFDAPPDGAPLVEAFATARDLWALRRRLEAAAAAEVVERRVQEDVIRRDFTRER